MDVAGAAVGVASLGIQICQGLLDYYHACESYDRDIQEAQRWIVHLQRTLVILGDTLQCANAKQDLFQNAQTGLLDCEDGIRKLEKKLRKIRKADSVTASDKTKAFGRRLIYPLHQSTVAKLKEIVKNLFEHLLLSIQVLQLDNDFNTQSVALHIDDTVSSISADTTRLESMARSQEARLERLSHSLQGIGSGTLAIQKELIGLPDQISQAVAGLLSKAQISQVARNSQLAKGASKSQVFDVLNWLRAPDPSAHHLRARKKYQSGTGQWFFKSSEFKHWLSGRSPWLWLSGAPGMGKTVLCSQAIEYIADQTRYRQAEALAYFYFPVEADRDTPPYQMLLLSLIVQLVDRRGDLLPDLGEACARDDQGVGTLEAILLQLLHLHVRTYIVIDGLDECPVAWSQRQDVLDGLHRLAAKSENLRLLVTSRPGDSDIEHFMQQELLGVFKLETTMVQNDIRLYLNETMGQDESMWAWTVATGRDIVDEICRKSEGNFLWATLVVQELRQQPLKTHVRIQQQVATLPKGLNSLSLILDANEESDLDSVLRILSWVSCARRPLTAREIMLAISTDSGYVLPASEDAADTLRRLMGPYAIFLSISELCTDRLDSSYLDEPIAMVRLSHYYVKSWWFQELCLSRRGSVSGSSAPSWYGHAFLARSCIEYARNRVTDGLHTEVSNASLRLLDYAIHNWRYHLEMARDTNDVAMTQQLHDLELQAESLPGINQAPQDRLSSSVRGSGTLAFRSLENGLKTSPNPGLLRTTPPNSITRAQNTDTESQLVRCFTTPLQQACFRGNARLVDRLLKRGANVNAQSGKFCSALHVAAYYGHADIVIALLEAGANVNCEGGCFGTALQAAIAHEHEEIVDILLDHGADVNITGDDTTSPGLDGDTSGLGMAPDYYDLPIRELQRVTTE
ncbi:hypothetical protein Q7P37_008875 [Cladosporium fusiforme]